jgi:hypothetical protein
MNSSIFPARDFCGLGLTSRRRKRADFHPSDQTSLDGETMPNVFIG